MNRMLFAVLALAAVLAFPCSAQTADTVGGSANAGSARTFDLTILHTNDYHGANEELLAKQTTLISGIRAETPNVLVLCAGDVFTRGRNQYRFFGELEFAVLNAQKIDALALGNNEFKATPDERAFKYLKARISQSRFPVLAANVSMKKTGKPVKGVKPYVVIERGGLRIGILGLTPEYPGSVLQRQTLSFADETESARTLYPEVAAKSDIVIALSHAGFGKDKQIAEEVPGLAAIIGGHSHTALEQPFMVGSVPIVQAGEAGAYLGRLDLHFEFADGRWVLKSSEGALLPVKDALPDAATTRIIDRYLERAEKKAS